MNALECSFFKSRCKGRERLFHDEESALKSISALHKGKYVEIISPCPESGRLRSKFYNVTKKGEVELANINHEFFGQLHEQ